MPNNGKKTGKEAQLNLFDLIQKQKPIIQKEGSLDIHIQFCHSISNAIRHSNLSRYQICAVMSELLRQDITVNMLNGWTAESKEEHRFPAEFLPAFCEAVGSYEPLQFLAQKSGLFIMPSVDALRSEIQKIDEQMEELQKEKERRVLFLEQINKK